MSKICRLLVVAVALVAFGMATMAVAQEFYVVKGPDGKPAVVDKKPADAASILKGPFKTKAEAEEALKGLAAAQPAKKPVKPPDEGC
ncbi:MAG: hypothetical protein FJY85_18390 [Deltaproteobacteria bacterium]|nr:hypothetical protein [Deltaproteobacteria bacterium]